MQERSTQNILTVDVEDWYMDLDHSSWANYEERIVDSTIRVLEILAENDVKATFFVVGYVAERHPDLILRMRRNGHEIASHGYYHRPISSQTPNEFEEDIGKSVRVLNSVIGEDICGYRACQFTITEKTRWALDIMKRFGIKYDSSVYPARTPLYGQPDAPLFPYWISSSTTTEEDPIHRTLLEIPLSVYTIPIVRKNIPVGGGFYLRLYPYWFTRRVIESINKRNQKAIVFIHPWELDVDQPRLRELPWYHYHNLAKTDGILRRLLKDFVFTNITDGILNERERD